MLQLQLKLMVQQQQQQQQQPQFAFLLSTVARHKSATTSHTAAKKAEPALALNNLAVIMSKTLLATKY